MGVDGLADGTFAELPVRVGRMQLRQRDVRSIYGNV